MTSSSLIISKGIKSSKLKLLLVARCAYTPFLITLLAEFLSNVYPVFARLKLRLLICSDNRLLLSKPPSLLPVVASSEREQLL
jgi:hypothetical protein